MINCESKTYRDASACPRARGKIGSLLRSDRFQVARIAALSLHDRDLHFHGAVLSPGIDFANIVRKNAIVLDYGILKGRKRRFGLRQFIDGIGLQSNVGYSCTGYCPRLLVPS